MRKVSKSMSAQMDRLFKKMDELFKDFDSLFSRSNFRYEKNDWKFTSPEKSEADDVVETVEYTTFGPIGEDYGQEQLHQSFKLLGLEGWKFVGMVGQFAIFTK